MWTIQSQPTRRVHLLVCSLAVIAGCRSTEIETPEVSVPAPPAVSVEPVKATHAPRPVRATAPTDKLHLLRTSGSVEGPIPYTVVEPAEGGPGLPIVFALHGRGDKVESFCRFVERLRLPMRFIVGEAPMPWGLGSGRRWFDMKSADLAAQLDARVVDVVTLAEKTAKRWPQAPPPLLLGFSQGAMLALQAIARRPDAFGGAIALSGSLLDANGLTRASTGKPVFLTAGETDRVVPMAGSERAAATLKALGHDTELFRFPGGHTVNREVVEQVRQTLRRWTSTPR